MHLTIEPPKPCETVLQNCLINQQEAGSPAGLIISIRISPVWSDNKFFVPRRESAKRTLCQVGRLSVTWRRRDGTYGLTGQDGKQRLCARYPSVRTENNTKPARA